MAFKTTSAESSDGTIVVGFLNRCGIQSLEDSILRTTVLEIDFQDLSDR